MEWINVQDDDNVDVDNNGTLDGCENCTDYITENSNSIISNSRAANISISTNSIVATGSIDYRAGQEVNLTEGIEVELGAIFHAYISPCN